MAGKPGQKRKGDHQRLDECEQLILAGMSNRQVENILSQRWGLSERQVRRYITRVNAELASAAEQTRQIRRAQFRGMTLATYRKAMAKNALIPAVQSLQLLAKVDGFEAPQEVNIRDVTVKDEVRRMSPRARQARMEELLAKKAAAEAKRGTDEGE